MGLEGVEEWSVESNNNGDSIWQYLYNFNQLSILNFHSFDGFQTHPVLLAFIWNTLYNSNPKAPFIIQIQK